MRERREVTQPFSSDLPMINKLTSWCKWRLLLPLSHVEVPVVLVEICPADQTMEISLEKCFTWQDQSALGEDHLGDGDGTLAGGGCEISDVKSRGEDRQDADGAESNGHVVIRVGRVPEHRPSGRVRLKQLLTTKPKGKLEFKQSLVGPTKIQRDRIRKLSLPPAVPAYSYNNKLLSFNINADLRCWGENQNSEKIYFSDHSAGLDDPGLKIITTDLPPREWLAIWWWKWKLSEHIF